MKSRGSKLYSRLKLCPNLKRWKTDQGQAKPLADGRDEVFAAWLDHDAAALVQQEDKGVFVHPENVSNCDTVVRPNKDLDIIASDYRGGVTTVSSDTISSQSELEELVDFLPLAQTPEDFANLVDGTSLELVQDAIMFQPDQPRRQQLMQWLQGLNFPAGEVEPCQSWQETIKAYAGLLAEGMLFGVEVVKALLKPWSSEQRWAAFLQLESQAPEKMRRLAATVPDWYKLCDAT